MFSKLEFYMKDAKTADLLKSGINEKRAEGVF